MFSGLVTILKKLISRWQRRVSADSDMVPNLADPTPMVIDESASKTAISESIAVRKYFSSSSGNIKKIHIRAAVVVE